MTRFARVFVMMLVWLVLPNMQAQTENPVRVLRASYIEDELVIDLQVADETIRAATLTVGGNTRPMSLDALKPEITHWFLLDAGDSMIDAYPLVRDELTSVAPVATDRYRIGFISYGTDINILAPTNSRDELVAWIQNYRAVPVVQGCVFDAIAQLPDSGNNLQLVTVITGSQAIPAGCDTPSQAINGVLDIIQADAPRGSELVTIAQEAGGLILSGHITRLSSAFDSLPSATNNQIQTVRVPASEAIERVTLAVELGNGDIITRDIEPTGTLQIPVTATPLPTATVEIPTSTPVANTQVPTIVPTSVPEQIAVPTQVPEDATPETTGISNGLIIMLGGLAAVVVVIIVVFLLLRGRRSEPAEETTHTGLMESTHANLGVAPTQQLDTTHVVSMRDLASQLGDTHTANLLDLDKDNIYEIHRPVSILGRQAGSDILVEGDMQISREHLRFEVREDGDVWAVKLTTNPVLVNGIPVENVVKLKEGDVIQLSPRLRVTFTSITERSDQ